MDKDAEIASLREELDATREESGARLRRFCVPHWGDKNNGNCPLCERDLKDAEIARLKAALEQKDKEAVESRRRTTGTWEYRFVVDGKETT